MNAYNYCEDFSTYLHNPYSFINEKQKAAILSFRRKSRFIEGYDINYHLKEVLTIFFGNREKLEKYGLTKYYNELKDYVEQNNLIGLILYGADLNNTKFDKQFICQYTKQNNITITLKATIICQILLKEYFNNDEKVINSLCEKTPNFEIYYKQ